MCKKHRDPVLFRGKEKPDPFNRAALGSHYDPGFPYPAELEYLSEREREMLSETDEEGDSK